MWSKEKLNKLAAERKAGRQSLGLGYEQAALLYARSRGLTDESQAERVAAAHELERLVDGMEPEQWNKLEKIVPTFGDGVFKGLLQYALERALITTTEHARRVAKMPEWPVKDRGRDR